MISEFLTGSPPFFDLPPMSAMFKIGESQGPPPLPTDVIISDNFKDLLLQCFKIEPGERPSAEQLFNHKALTQSRSLTRNKVFSHQIKLIFLILFFSQKISLNLVLIKKEQQ